MQNEGSIFILTPVSEEAVAWVADNLPEDVTTWAGGVVVEPRYIGPIIDGIKNEGLTLDDDGTAAHTAAAGDEHDEAEEMTLDFGDLADLAPSLPSITAKKVK